MQGSIDGHFEVDYEKHVKEITTFFKRFKDMLISKSIESLTGDKLPMDNQVDARAEDLSS